MLSLAKGLQTSKRFQVLVVGSLGCGKSSVLHRLLHNAMPPESNTNVSIPNVSMDLYVKEFSSKIGKAEKSLVYLWDCPGAMRIRPMITQLYNGTKGVILCYDITSVASFKELVFWYNEVMRQIPDACVVIAGLKSDLMNDAIVSTKDALTQAKAWNVPHISVCAKTGTGVDELFNTVFNLIKAL